MEINMRIQWQRRELVMLETSKKYGCVCTWCHKDYLHQYMCVIFLRNNYNFDIPAVANALWKRQRIRQKEFICKPCHKQLKGDKYSNNVQNCDSSDLFGSHLNHEEGSQDSVHKNRTHNENNMTCNFPSLYMTQTTTLTNYCLAHVAIKLIYQDHNISSSKKQSMTLAMLLFEKHYQTDSQFLHPRNTFARNVTSIY